MEEDRPNPDALLNAIKREELKASTGALKIFFGMSAGVGKTYAMLQEAQELSRNGVDVLIGTINTHGRKETEELLQGLRILPEKLIKYKDTIFEELDIDSILEIKPQLVLIDELAHTNVPGAKHNKRWQDVVEFLNAGIDVYTTLNVQHIETRKDVVESIVGIKVRETVPDLMLERATTIELVDISPQELLQRMREGKVYFGDQSQIAIDNFFKKESLTALREIALRLTAEKVEHDLHGILLEVKGWKIREKLMVALSLGGNSEHLIRATRKRAFELDAPWVVVYVDTGKILGDEEQTELNRLFNLARELGAEVISTHDMDIANGLQRIIRQKEITRVVIGRRSKSNFLNFFRPTLVNRIEGENPEVDLLVLREESRFPTRRKLRFIQRGYSPLIEYIVAVAAVFLLTLINSFVAPLWGYWGYKIAGYIYLAGILMMSFFIGQGPIFLAAIMSGVAWVGVFILSQHANVVTEYDNIALLILYLFIAAIGGLFSSRIRRQEAFLRMREEKMEHFREVESTIAKSLDFQQLRLNVCSLLSRIYSGKFNIFIKNEENGMLLENSLDEPLQEKDKAAANWVLQHGSVGGWSTETLPSAEGMYLPIKFSKTTIGALGYYPKRKRPLTMDEINLLELITQDLGIYMQRLIFEERVSKQDYTRQIERMHQAIFHSFKRSFYAPLDAATAVSKKLEELCTTSECTELLLKQRLFISNFKLTVDNVVAISELESGFVKFERGRYLVKDLVRSCLIDLKSYINGHKVETHFNPVTHYVYFDFNLMKIAVKNLLINAFDYSPQNSTIEIKEQLSENEFKITILDRGPGVPDDLKPQIFEKFYRLPGTSSEGLGLGLAIVKKVVQIHQGHIEVNPRSDGGTEITLYIPSEIA